MLILHVIGVFLAVLCVVVMVADLMILLPTIGGAIFYPSRSDQVETMLKLAKIHEGEKAIDIGSGDGRIVAALARVGARADGVEISPILVWISRLKLRAIRTRFPMRILFRSFWHLNFRDYQVVTIFGMSYIMRDLERKLLRELPVGARVICNSFPFPNWPATKEENHIYLYVKMKEKKEKYESELHHDRE